MSYVADPTHQPKTRNSTLVYHVAYASYAIAFLGPLPIALVGLFLAYAQSGYSRGGPLQGHSGWLIWTFWISLPLVIVGGILAWILVGWLILIPLWIWFVYRIIRGWIALANKTSP